MSLNKSFEEWAALAAANPEQFEKERREALLAEVAKAPVEQQAALHSLVDKLMSSSPPGASGLERAVHAHNLMSQGVNNLAQSWETLAATLKGSKAEVHSSDMLARFTSLVVKPKG